MFHAPTAEAKARKDVRSSQSAPEPVRERSPFVPDMVGPVFSGAAAGAGAPRTDNGGMARQLVGLHSMYGNQAILRTLAHAPAVIQTKLTVNKPGDEFEQEADRVADQVMRMSVPSMVQRSCSACQNEEKVQRKCAECEEEEKKTGLQRKETDAGPQFAPPSVGSVLNSSGRPLDRATRAFMEPRFGVDFSGVRIHDGSQAAESARAVNALAYTHGRNIVFNTGQYTPVSDRGRHLLAHELAHVVQQSGDAGTRLSRKELPDEDIPKDWPLPNPFTEGTEKCRWEEGDLKCYKVKCEQTKENKTHCYYDGPYDPAPEPEKKPAPAPAAKQAVTGTDSKGQDFVVYEKEIRVGGTRTWRNNNPGNFDKAEDHPKNIGNDSNTRAGQKRSFLIFPDSTTGMQELIDSIKAHGTSSIRTFITAHAPPNENPTETYITEVVGYVNNGDAIGECKITKPAKPISDATVIGNMSDSEQVSLAMAMAREEGFCDVTQKKATYTCDSKSIPDEYKGKLTCP